MCWGSCCPVVNVVLNTLIECGELDKDVEVRFIECYILVYVLL